MSRVIVAMIDCPNWNRHSALSRCAFAIALSDSTLAGASPSIRVSTAEAIRHRASFGDAPSASAIAGRACSTCSLVMLPPRVSNA